MNIIDLRSDTVTKPSISMRQAMARAVVGDDVFDDDPTVKKLEALVARMLEKEKGLYVPSGTMGNEVCLKVLTRPGDEVLTEAGSHIYRNEVGAPSALSGIQLHIIQGNKGVFTAEQIEKEIHEINMSIDEIDKGGYPHFMLKEIMEQPESTRNSMRGRLLIEEGSAKLGGLNDIIDRLVNSKRILISIIQ